MFEDTRHELSLISLTSITDPDILKQSKFTDHEVNIIKNFALEKLHRQRVLEEYIALSLKNSIFCLINVISKFEKGRAYFVKDNN